MQGARLHACLRSGVHKESASIQCLIHAAQGPAIVTLHAKFQLVLVPVVSVVRRVLRFEGTAEGYLDHAESLK